MFIIFSFFALIMVSLAARFFEGRLSKYNFVIFTLKYVPAVCAFMGAAFVFALILQRCVSGSVSKQAFIFIFFAQVLAIIAAGFCVFLHCARKMNFSFLKTCLSFLLGFVFSLVLTLVLFAANCFLYFNTFQYLKIHPDHTCQMRLKPLFSFCPEYDRQIVFKSGKIIGIHLDTCGLSDFKVYKLNNGNLYLECMQNFGNSYVIDEENEKVYMVLGGNVAELKIGDPIDGMDIGPDIITYHTYGESGRKTYNSNIEVRSRLLENKKFLGSFFSRYGFSEK